MTSKPSRELSFSCASPENPGGLEVAIILKPEEMKEKDEIRRVTYDSDRRVKNADNY
jgi:hypothetical protein